MGQQQLLLLVMGIVIVGVAVVAGFQMAEVSMKQHDADVLVGRALTIASDAVYWKTKNDPYNNGNADYADLETGGFSELFLLEETENGRFKIVNASGNEFQIIGESKRFPDVGIRVSVNRFEIVSTEIDHNGGISIDD